MGKIIDFEKEKEVREICDTLFNAMKKTKLNIDKLVLGMGQIQRHADLAVAKSWYLKWHAKVWSPE